MMKKLQHLAEYFLLRIFLLIFGKLGFWQTSQIFGVIFSKIGVFLKSSKVAKRNLKNILGLESPESDHLIKNLWNNFGKTMGELVALDKIGYDNILELAYFEGEEHLAELNQGGIFITCHIGNWEILPAIISKKLNSPAAIIYKPLKNQLIDRYILNLRKKYTKHQIAIGEKSIRKIANLLQSQQIVGGLLDQNFKQGPRIKFLGVEAHTSTVLASLSVKFDKPIILVYSIRMKDKKQFKITIEKPLHPKDYSYDKIKITEKINETYGEWIKSYPDSWLCWSHNRWK